MVNCKKASLPEELCGKGLIEKSNYQLAGAVLFVHHHPQQHTNHRTLFVISLLQFCNALNKIPKRFSLSNTETILGGFFFFFFFDLHLLFCLITVFFLWYLLHRLLKWLSVFALLLTVLILYFCWYSYSFWSSSYSNLLW